jgi:hypothetical protein
VKCACSGALYDLRGGVLRKTNRRRNALRSSIALLSPDRGRKALVPRSDASSRTAVIDDIARRQARNEQVRHKKLIRFLYCDPCLIRRRNSAHTSVSARGLDYDTVPRACLQRVSHGSGPSKSPRPIECRSRSFFTACAAPSPGTAEIRPCGSRRPYGRRGIPRRRAGCQVARAPGAAGARHSAA